MESIALRHQESVSICDDRTPRTGVTDEPLRTIRGSAANFARAIAELGEETRLVLEVSCALRQLYSDTENRIRPRLQTDVRYL